MRVKKVGVDLYEVNEFSQVMSHLVFQVHFDQGQAQVVFREGTTETTWDRMAISAVQTALIADQVEQ